MITVKKFFFVSTLCSLLFFISCSEDPVIPDSDQDGVPDTEDQCANTPTGESVDDFGCSETQNDSDGDGVHNTEDQCSGTPVGSTVDAEGCADSQKDTDGDGVNDDLDQCTDTSAGIIVDDEGCALYITRSENGVTLQATEQATTGESYELDGVNYIVVDSALLYTMAQGGEDISRVITTRVNSLQRLSTYLPGFPNVVFNQDLSTWDVSNITDFSYSFMEASSFDQDLSAWNVQLATDMTSMFKDNTIFNQDLSNWNISNVTSTSNMFAGAGNFDQNIGSWNMESVVSADSMFAGASSFNQDLSSWNVSSITNMYGMFQSASSFNQDLGSWSVEQVTNCALFSENTTDWTATQPNFTNCSLGELAANYEFSTTDIWCNGASATGSVEIEIRSDGQYTFSDWSMGAYSACYGPSSNRNWGQLAFSVIADVQSFTGFIDAFGDTWTFNNVTIDGEVWSFDWENTYGEGGSVAVTFPGGVPFVLEQ